MDGRERADVARRVALQNGEIRGKAGGDLAIRQQMLGNWHPDTAKTLTVLGLVFVSQANELKKRRYRAPEPYLPRYPEQRNKLEKLSGESVSLSKAKEYLEQAVTAFEQTLGSWTVSGEATRARSMLEEVKQRLGEDSNPNRFAPPSM